MLLALLVTIAACGEQERLPLAPDSAGASAPLQESVVRGCARIVITLPVAAGEVPVAAVAAGSDSCGPLQPVITGSPEWDAARGRLRVPVALRNGSALKAKAPFTLRTPVAPPATDAAGLALRANIVAAQPDTFVREVALLHFDSAIAHTRRAERFGVPDPAGASILPGGESAPRWVEADVSSSVKEVTLELTASAVQRFTVPAAPTRLVEEATWAESRAHENVLTPGNGNSPWVRHRLWIGFEANAPQEMRQSAIDAVDGEFLGLRANGWYYIEIPAGRDEAAVLKAVRQLRGMPGVISANPHLLRSSLGPIFLAPRDGSTFQQWKLLPSVADGANWGLEAIAAPYAWGCVTDGSDANIGIVDYGFRNVADLVANVAPGAPFDTDPKGHGTQVASIIGARGANDSLMTGVPWRTQLHLYSTQQADPPASTDSAVWPFRAIGRAGRDGRAIINLSLGIYWKARFNRLPQTTSSIDSAEVWVVRDEFRNQVDALRAAGNRPLLVVAASNDGIDAWWSGLAALADDPAYRAQILVVGANRNVSSASGQLAAFSNRGRLVDVAAPGIPISVLGVTGTIKTDSGTSLAAPFATGIAGLLRGLDPTLPGDSLRALIIRGAVAGVRTAADPSNPARPIPIVNAYESLKLAAQRPGAGVCGNRIWATGDSVMAERAGGVADLLYRAGGQAGGVQAHHRNLLRTKVGWHHFRQGVWSVTSGPGGTLDTLPAGTASSRFAYSHNQDSAATVDQVYPTVDYFPSPRRIRVKRLAGGTPRLVADRVMPPPTPHWVCRTRAMPGESCVDSTSGIL